MNAQAQSGFVQVLFLEPLSQAFMEAIYFSDAPFLLWPRKKNVAKWFAQ
jgi:hypothetical protein